MTFLFTKEDIFHVFCCPCMHYFFILEGISFVTWCHFLLHTWILWTHLLIYTCFIKIILIYFMTSGSMLFRFGAFKSNIAQHRKDIRQCKFPKWMDTLTKFFYFYLTYVRLSSLYWTLSKASLITTFILIVIKLKRGIFILSRCSSSIFFFLSIFKLIIYLLVSSSII